MAAPTVKELATTLLGLATFVAASNAQEPIQPPAGLLAWWAMDGTAEDLGALGLHGALADPGGDWIEGRVAAGFRALLPGGHVVVPDAPELRLRSNFTFEAWVRLDALPVGLTYLVSKGTADHRASPFTFGLIGSDNVLVGSSVIGVRGPGRPFVSLSDGAADRVVIANRALVPGAFTHLAFTVTDTMCTVYVDGVNRGMSSGTRLPFAGVQSLRLGGTFGGNSLQGVLDEVSCYARALSAAEIQAIWAAGPRGKQKPARDRTPPVVAIDAPLADSVVAERMLALRATVLDESATHVESVPAGLAVDLPAGGGTAVGSVLLGGPDGPQVVAVRATDGSGNEAATSVTVVLDTTAPAVLVLSPAEGALVGAATAAVAIAVDDLTATVVEVDGQVQSLPPGRNAVTFDVALREGTNTLTVVVTDAAGHRSVVVRRVVLDLSGPVVAIDSPPDGALFGAGDGNVAVSARVDDLAATTVTSAPAGVAGALPAGGGLLSGVVTLEEGFNRIAVRAVDEFGRAGEAAITVVLDRTAPGATFASPMAGVPLRGTVSVEVSAVDAAPGSGVARLEVFAGEALLGAAAGPECRFDLDTATLGDGDRMLRAVATDGAGNAGVATLWLSIDNTPPTVRIFEPVAGTVAGTIGFVALATDGGSGLVEIVQRVGGRAPMGDGSAAFDPPAASGQVLGSEDTLQWPDGALQFEVEATDAAGNTAIVEVLVDVQNVRPGTGPRLSPRDGAVVRGRVRLSASFDDRRDLLGLELQVDGQRVAHGPGPRVSAWVDTTQRIDGPMVVRALLRTRTGTAETVHTLQVHNLRLLALSPQVLSIDRTGRGSVSAIVQGPAAAIAQLLAQRPQLRVPGGAAVAMRSFDLLPVRCRGGERWCVIRFDGAELVAAIVAARATGALPDDASSVRVQLGAGDRVVGRTRLWLCGVKVGRR